MPVYEYTCVPCDKEYTFQRGINDDDPGYNCEICDNKLIRSYSSFAIQFKGSGFYKTDSAKNK